ncbi:ATP-dependent RNA helicase FAL1 OS=Ustilago maydis (strain 521 / FGSC 9021) GN=FAL1 PE=3 SV=1 [Rhizoctonia solani AG-1 IB]|uniref:ATP-dependent RNA helicase n=1 Tax=Thanatephorus cucumeris (strain AG1-IB / isolate 7/3/14) TaxID=1108050 RepID=A0A0B7G5Z5_THACB|nr:ATP-dependent RNA helicase FAL1 OS=Ustilago maydis (strain 521 / FGSC 9021) GN=FAL1 PE=3 SV=1 [Rhizoctonia solani AG-1 IB]
MSPIIMSRQSTIQRYVRDGRNLGIGAGGNRNAHSHQSATRFNTMSHSVPAEEYDPPSARSNNNSAPRSSQNKPQLLDAMMRNVPKLKELNYTHWNNMITNSIKKSKLWGYVDGGIQEPSDHDAGNLATYYDEIAAVRNAILGSLEPGAQKYIEDTLDARDAWLALEKKYLTAEAETDAELLATEKRLADMRLEEDGDMVEHIAEFCRMRCRLNGTRFALDDQACISMLYRSLPSSYRQSALTAEKTEMKDFGALCARLSDLSQNPQPHTIPDDAPEDYTSWGVPKDVKAFELTGSKNPLLAERATVTCRDCLLKDHKAGTPDCPQYEWRKELWGTESNDDSVKARDLGNDASAERPAQVNTKRLSYEFSEPVKVVLSFDELGLKSGLMSQLTGNFPKPLAIQQCAVLPIMHGRNVFVQAPSKQGKTTTLVMSILQLVDTMLPHAQALVFTSTNQLTTAFQGTLNRLGSGLSVRCYPCSSSNPLAGSSFASFAGINNHHIFVGTPNDLLEFVRRNIINMRKIKVVVLDDIDKLIEAGTEQQILEVIRHVPSLAQIVASSTSFSLSISGVVSKLLADPLQVLVNRNEGITVGCHFYIRVPEEKKLNALCAIFSTIGGEGFVVLCQDSAKLKSAANRWGTSYQNYYLHGSMKPEEYRNTAQDFASKLAGIRYKKANAYNYYSHDPISRVLLVTATETLPTTELSNIATPLINYDVPKDVEDYIRWLNHWHTIDPSQSQTIITLVTAETDEIHVIQNLVQFYGVHIELLWGEGGIH